MRRLSLPFLTLMLTVTGCPMALRAVTLTTLYNFPTGSLPNRVTLGENGALFGTTELGGTPGLGTVFILTPPKSAGDPWTESDIFTFTGTNGSYPSGPLTIGPRGALYGTTNQGGSAGVGTLFELSPPVKQGQPWTETVLYDFDPASGGSRPSAAVTLSSGGTLYGTTDFGGTESGGTVYAVSPPSISGGAWTYNVIYNFPNAGEIVTQAGLAIGSNGILYGVGNLANQSVCGSVFSLTPPRSLGETWTEQVIYNFPLGSFPVCPDGEDPEATLTVGSNGTLYGTTNYGGFYDDGVVFQLESSGSPAVWNESVLYTFAIYGGNPGQSGLVLGKQGELYGTAEYPSNGTSGDGSAFVLIPSGGGGWNFNLLAAFNSPEGVNPVGIVGAKGALFGTAQYGGAFNGGAAFEVSP